MLPAYKEKRVYVDFEGVASYSQVYVNVHNIGDHKGGAMSPNPGRRRGDLRTIGSLNMSYHKG